jgi:pimeloyl-ACP methyl ester carboxylesterase
MRALLFLIFLMIAVEGFAQRTITFPSEDNLTITADLYLKDKDLPFIILFHQANSSRGEYIETAHKLTKLDYNCLAVDLRSGKEINYIQNLTAVEAAEKKLPTTYLDAERDILASIAYVKNISSKKIILFGSSYSASLVMKTANHNPDVLAVVAFSPGEYFQPRLILKSTLEDYDKPIFVASTSKEKPFVQELIGNIPDNLIMFFVPKESEGTHGSKALWENQTGSEEVWLSLLLFFEKIDSK